MRKSEMTKQELITKVQETCFACLEMNLYLDNHPEDKNAISTYNALCNQFAKARYAYEYPYTMVLI